MVGRLQALRIAEDGVERTQGEILEEHDVVWTDASGVHPTDYRKRVCTWAVVWHARPPVPPTRV